MESMQYMQSVDKKDLEDLAGKLSYIFNNISLLEQSLMHRSFINEHSHGERARGRENNERLEFLGDAILSASISHILIERFPDMDEGNLSKFRARLVNETTLSKLAMDIDLGKYLLLGKGEELTGGREKPSILSDTYEAIIAAVYLDGGFSDAFSLVSRQFCQIIEDVSITELARDYKTELQEQTHCLFKSVPKYYLISETGPEHNKVFEVEVSINAERFEKGQGKTKKEAEQKAAMKTLERLKKQF